MTAAKPITSPKPGGIILEAILELERMYDAVAERAGPPLAGGMRPVILIQTAGRKSAYGWMAPESWATMSGTRNEITLCAEHLARGPLAAFETLVHEMAHHANDVDGIADCNKAQYHNGRFRDRAAALGLVVERSERHGWSQTKLSPELEEFAAGLKIKADVFEVFRLVREREKAPTKMKKWTCGCTTVRCATKLDAQCAKCGAAFAVEESTKET